MAAEAAGRLCGRVVGGRYRLGILLARGAAGVVYEAEDLEGGEAVAVKLLLSRDEGARLRLLREAEAITAVAHPCIPRVHGAGTLDGHIPYLVLDRFRGETLGAYLRREGAAEARRLLALLLRGAEALGVAHGAGIVHRDVKPDNLFLLGPVGAPTDLRVLDFGLSRGATRLTEPGIAVGTAEYMAPEQVVTDPVDGRTDLYAFGVVLFRALSGHLPFEDRDKLRLMARQLLEPCPPLVFALPCPAPLAAPLAGLVAGLLRKDPDSRLPSMNDLASRLRSLLCGGPALDLPPVLRMDYQPRSSFARRVLGGFCRRLGYPVLGQSGDEDDEEG
jgi:serine/threonine protein kinase